MNVAFSAMLAFILLIPGFVFLRARRATGKHAKLVTNAAQPFSVEIALAIALAIAIHAVACTLVYFAHVLGPAPRINFEAAIMLLSGHFGQDEKYLSGAIASIASHPIAVVLYFFFTLFLGGLAGTLSNVLPKTHPIGFCLFDQREMVMDEWGDFFNLGQGSGAIVTAVVEMGGKPFLFLGTLRDLRFNSATAELERIELMNVAKRILEEPASSSALLAPEQLVFWPDEQGGESDDDQQGLSFDGFEPVFGNQFVLRMSEIKTLNVVYFDKQESG